MSSNVYVAPSFVAERTLDCEWNISYVTSLPTLIMYYNTIRTITLAGSHVREITGTAIPLLMVS